MRKNTRHTGVNQQKYLKPCHCAKAIVRFEGEQNKVPVSQLQKEALAPLQVMQVRGGYAKQSK